MAVKGKITERLALWLVPRLYEVVSRLLFLTCRVDFAGVEHRRRCEAAGPFIAAFWHYSVFAVVEAQRVSPQEWTAMVSRSRDAELLARLLERQGCETVRGSRNRGGVAALKGLIASLRRGRCAAIVADGSQGPPRVMQAGALLLASRAGVPILPVAVAADRYVAFKSWDRTMLPKPFARLAICYGEPLTVPAKADAAAIEEYRQRLEQRLNSLYQEAWERFGRSEH